MANERKEERGHLPKADDDLKYEVMKSADKDLKIYAKFSKDKNR